MNERNPFKKPLINEEGTMTAVKILLIHYYYIPFSINLCAEKFKRKRKKKMKNLRNLIKDVEILEYFMKMDTFLDRLFSLLPLFFIHPLQFSLKPEN